MHSHLNAIREARDAGRLTRDGADWLCAAVDLFHDTDLRVAGYPDVQSASTCVQLVRKQMTVSKPTNVSGNWDCNISMLPVHSVGVTANGGSQQRLTTVTNGDAYYTSGDELGLWQGGTTAAPLVAIGVSPGMPTWPGQGTAFNAFAQVEVVGQLGYDEFTNGKYRLIACGFEVENTTSDLYKQGSVTYYRQPCSGRSDSLGTKGDAFQYSPVTYVDMPPGTLAETQLLHGTVTRRAEDGAYVMGRINSSDIPLVTDSGTPILFSTTPVPGGSTAEPSFQQCVAVDFRSLNAAGNVYNLNGTIMDRVQNFDTSGAYFTGLSAETTLTITGRWLIERCPTADQVDLAVLASPSATYDPVALQMYVQAISGMPPGVPVGENPLGEWFAKVMRNLAKAAPYAGKILAPVLGPEAIPVANLAGKAIGWAAKKVEKSNTQKQQHKQKAKNGARQNNKKK